jgi:two-component system response regulator RegA
MNGRRKALIVDQDEAQCLMLREALLQHDFEVLVAHDAATAMRIALNERVTHAIVDLRAPDHEGLRLVETFKDSPGSPVIVVLATHPSIATAVEAIKRGATHYLPKPVSPLDVIAACNGRDGNLALATEERPLSLEALVWEYIDRVLVGTGGNVSAAARALDMHRRTLQRKLRQRTWKARGKSGAVRSRNQSLSPVEAG